MQRESGSPSIVVAKEVRIDMRAYLRSNIVK